MQHFTRGIVWSLSLALSLGFAAGANAAIISPQYTTGFGTLSAASFGGSGIPNNAVAITTITNGGNTITLGLTAFGRYANPQLTNNNAGTFYAGAGANNGLDVTPHSLGATWNFGYYVDIQGGGSLANYNVDLLYDLNPAAGTDESVLGVIHFDAFAPTSTTHVEDSQNPLFGFLSSNANFPGIEPPAGYPPSSFDPNAAGEYTFALRVYDASSGALLGTSAINVVVTPEPASMAIWGIGALGCAVAGYRRRKQAV